jgi:hypothetical protein
MRNVPDGVVEKIKTHFIKAFSVNRAFYEIMWKTMVKPGRPQMTI